MELQPLITVITAAYNSCYLFEAIDSVLEQTYPRIEYIVTDDGSKSFSVTEVEDYIKKRKKDNLVSYKVIHHEENLGTVKNLNNALRISRGKYIFNLAADDQFMNKYILEQWVLDMQEQQSDFSMACFQRFDEKMKEKGDCVPLEYQKKILLSRNQKKIFNELAIGNFIYGCVTALSRDCLNKFGMHDESYRLIEDYPYVLTYLRNGGRVDLFDQLAVRYRQGGASSANKFNKIYEQDSDLILKKEILPYVKKKRLYTKIYIQWKKNQKNGFWIKSASLNQSRKILLYLKNPIQLYISIRRLILKKVMK